MATHNPCGSQSRFLIHSARAAGGLRVTPAVRAKEPAMNIDRIDVFPLRYPMAGYFKFFAGPRGEVGTGRRHRENHGQQRRGRLGPERSCREMELRNTRGGDGGVARLLRARLDRTRCDRSRRCPLADGSTPLPRAFPPGCRSPGPGSTLPCTICWGNCRESHSANCGDCREAGRSP